MLAAYRRWGTDESYKTVVEALVKFFFKFRVVRRQHPGEVERVMLKIAEMIEKRANLNDILNEIKNHDDHEHFLAEFGTEFVKRLSKSVAKYVLQQITIHLQTPYDDVKPIDGLTLEHILPQDNKEWEEDKFFKDYPGPEYDKNEFVVRLGNLTLLKSAINSKMKNRTFFEKKNATNKDGVQVGYNSSKLAINKETVCNKDEWTANTIIEREKLFKEYADKIWHL